MTTATHTRVRVPSQQFWTMTPFHLDLPDGWTARQTVDMLVYAEHESGTATCAVHWSRVPASLGLEQVATISFAKILRVDKAAKVTFNGFGRHHGLQSYLRVCEFTTEKGARRAQSFLALNGPVFGPTQPIELFEVTGHFDAGDTDRLAEIETIIASFHFALTTPPLTADSDSAQTSVDTKVV